MQTGTVLGITKWVLLLLVFSVFGHSVHFVFKPTVIMGTSMSPTLEDGHRLLLNTFKKTYDHGDIVVFHIPDSGLFIKRVIGIEGDQVDIMDGSVYLNWNKLDEPYVHGRGTLFGLEMTVPENHVYVMGDNRSNSVDSRVLGAVPESEIMGSLMVRIPFVHSKN